MAANRLIRWGEWQVRHRWWVIAAWCVLFAMGLYFSPRVESILQGGTRLPGSESTKVVDILKSQFSNRFGYELVIVFNSNTRNYEDDMFRQAVENIQLGLRDSLKVNSVMTYYDTNSPDMVSQSGHSILGVVELDAKDLYGVQKAIPELRKIVSGAGAPKWLNVYVTGEGAVYHDLILASSKDAFEAEARSFPLVIIVLVFTFGALLACGIPVILGLVAVFITLGVLYFLGLHIPMFVLAKNTASMIGLGVGIDYSLFMVSRFREELRNGISPKEAAAAILPTSGKTVLFSGATVIVGIAALFIAGVTFLNSMAISSISVVIIAVLAALTLLPALLSLLGPHINWPETISGLISKTKTGRFWHRLAMSVMKRPVVFFFATFLLLIGLAFPLVHLKTYTPTVVGLPRGVESRLGFERLQTDFVAGKMAPLNIIIQAPKGQSIWSADSVARIYKLSRLIAGDRRVSKVEGIVDVDPGLTLADYQSLYSGEGGISSSENIFAQMVSSYADNKGRFTLMRVTTVDEPGSLAARSMVTVIRSELIPAAYRSSAYQVLVGGGSAGEVDLDKILMRNLPFIIGLVCVITFIILMFLFHSILIPLKSIFMNLLSVLASFGVLVLIFQDGVISRFTGLKAPGGISSVVLVMLFSVLFGLSMDYEIFLTLRMKEEHDNGKNNEESVAWGLEKTGSMVTSAALIMVVVFGAFAFTSMMMTQEFGLGLAAAVFLDATIIRVLLMPATMRLMGEWNWWFPKGLEKIVPKIYIKE